MNGEINMDKTMNFGQFLKEMRKSNRHTLRSFCILTNYDPGNLSRIENSKLQPPQDFNTLEKFAVTLNMQEGSDDWYTFFSLAKVENNLIPTEILNPKTVGLLPAFFRSLAKEKVQEDILKQLIHKLEQETNESEYT